MADDGFTELSQLARDIGAATESIRGPMSKAVEVSARNIKDETRQKYTGATNLPGAARSITYTTFESSSFTGGTQFQADIGPELGGQGSIVGLVELGAGSVAPRGYLTAALADEAEGFETGIQRALADALASDNL